ncbi:MAG: hypothetical protein DRR19_08460 [Candidatus Parabeggiatoa sp. nov. 1]|nr:MAG: hypothetical protein DRR19_08460 [Gammaproteobacteria bacterium]
MSDFSSCPSCGHTPYQGLMGGWFKVYKCNACGGLFCHECKGSNNGSKCPKCGSTNKSTAGKSG